MARTYQLLWNLATQQPPGGIRVTVDVPPGWTEVVDPLGCPTFAVPGTDNARISITTIHAPGASAAARLEWAASKQYGAELPQLTRAARADGGCWIVQRPGGRIHARRFLPAPHESIVMASVITFAPTAAAWLPTIEAVFETVRVSG